MNFFTEMNELFFIRCQWVDDVIHNLFFQIRPHIEAHHRGVWVRAWYNVFASPFWAVRLWTFKRAFYVCDLWQVVYRLFVWQLKGSFCKVIIGVIDSRTRVTEKLRQLSTLLPGPLPWLGVKVRGTSWGWDNYAQGESHESHMKMSEMFAVLLRRHKQRILPSLRVFD